MCGLSGVAGDISLKEERAFKTLLKFSAIRGEDATGVGSVSRSYKNNDKDILIAKDTGPPYFLFDTKNFDKCFQGNNLCYIGHNRYGTTGDKTRKSAHPFLFEDILGAHNGTLDYINKNRLEHGEDFKTDSEAIFNNIQVHGIEDTISKIEEDQAYALTWYDRKDNSLNFLRNKERPLWYIYTQDHKVLFWASEFELLMAAVGREGILTTQKPFVTTIDQHYKWIIPDTPSELPEPIRKKYKNHKSFYSGYAGSSFHDNWKKNKDTEKRLFGTESKRYSFDHETGEYTTDTVSPLEKPLLLPHKGVLETIKDGFNALVGVETKVEETKAVRSKILTAQDVLKKRKLEELDRLLAVNDPLGVEKAKLTLYYEDDNVRIHRNKETGEWRAFRWDPARGEWGTHLTTVPPKDLPFKKLDINARHNFHHEGKGKTRKDFYKGFRGSLLNQDQFNKMMQTGCLNCERKPEWGNEVTFLDDLHHYLCEYCSKTPNLVSDLKQKKEQIG